MRGGAQSHLMRCDDGHFYVVKFQNNPQHRRVLANELLATRLAERAGLPVPQTRVIEVSEWLIEHTPELRVQSGSASEHCEAGLQFGARFVVDPLEGQVFDYCRRRCSTAFATSQTLPGCFASTSGHAIRMDARQCSGKKRASVNTTPRSL